MKLLVVGSQGFIGSHCYSYFSNIGFYTAGADILASPVLFQENYHTLQSSEPDFGQLFRSGQYDVCVNASGSANVGFSFSNPEKDHELNVQNVEKMLSAILTYSPGCKFINFSSAAVYGNPLNLPIKESDPTNPLSPYGSHKLESERLLSDYHHRHHLLTCSLRVFSAYGPGLRKQLFWDLGMKAKIDGDVKLFGTGLESRDFIYIDDLTVAVEKIIQHTRFQGECINVSSGIEETIGRVAGLFLTYFASGKKLSFNGLQKEGDPLNWKADVSILNGLDFKCAVEIEKGIKTYATWLQKEPGLV